MNEHAEGRGSLTTRTALTAALRAGLGDRLLLDEPLRRRTSMRVGGPARYLTQARTREELVAAVTLARRLATPYLILGNGTNVLIADEGINGLVIVNDAVTLEASWEEREEIEATVSAGSSLPALVRGLVARGLGGLEFAIGIPGTVGGAVVSNAGAWDRDVSSVLRRIETLDENGVVGTIEARDLGLGYRRSPFRPEEAASAHQPHAARQPDADQPTRCPPHARSCASFPLSTAVERGLGGEAITSAAPIPRYGTLRDRTRVAVLSATFGLAKRPVAALREQMEGHRQQRIASQPLEPSAGSVFKNPPGDSAGRLIEEAGLKGATYGGATISLKHANFIVNRGGASATDVLALIELARRTVHERTGVDLQLEIELIGWVHGVS